MAFAFLLGSSPALSYAEIESVFHGAALEKHGSLVFVDTNYQEVLSKFYDLGGSVRAFEVLDFETEIFDLIPAIKKYITRHATNGKKMKIAFFAQHPAFAKRNFMKWMQDIKSFAKQNGISLRIANRGDQNLDANAVDKEKLLENGNAEFAIGERDGKLVLMRTIAVQQVWKFITRDMKKPIRDMQVGMLPPKLARMMVNLSRENGVLPKTVYDPFCGTGTVLLESIDLGIRAIGSDFSEKMVMAASENTKWFAELVDVKNPEIFQKDASERFSLEQLALFLGKDDFYAIVAEGYLGHVYAQPLSDDQLKKERATLFPLYQSFLHASFQNKAIEKIVFGFPFWKTQKGKYSFVQDLFEDNLQWKKIKTLRYLREDQVVGREIVIATRAV